MKKTTKTEVRAKAKEKTQKTVPKKARYFEGIGRRKKAVARVRFYRSKPSDAKEAVMINGKSLQTYFPMKKNALTALSPLAALALKDYYLTVKVSGGGLNAQAEAIRLGLSRALVSETASSRPRLKALGYLTRDPRKVERKKFGSRKARRPQQWRKR